jgi:glycosyltransferase involved in cell wall biosynthesis
MAASAPQISVVIPAFDRPLRLLWLLNALEDQSLERGLWDVVVSDQSLPGRVGEILASHPLTRADRLRVVHPPPGTRTAAGNRNSGWRAAQGRLIVFTDDDCRPHEGWLAEIHAAAVSRPGAIVQGTTLPDPEEAHLLEALPHSRSLEVRAPDPEAPTCNIAYPREVLEALAGFDEHFVSGEDTDLFLRARRAGTGLVAAPEAIVYHAVTPMTLPGRMRFSRRWESLPLVVKRHPALRRGLPLGVFWRWRHAWLVVGLAGVAAAPRRTAALALAAPWAFKAAPRLGLRGLPRSLAALPGRAVLDATELAVLTRGSIRHRTVLL